MKTDGKVAQARSDFETIRIEEAKLLDTIRLEVRRAGDAVAESVEVVKALEETVTQAERLRQMAEKGFKHGVKIRLDVEDAETNLLTAKGSVARGRRDYLASRLDLEWATGMLGEKKSNISH